MALSKANRSLLAAIITSMSNAEQPFTFATAAQVDKLVKEGLAETNPDITDGDKLAVRATEKGITTMTDTSTGGTSAVTTSTFAIDDGVPLPPASNRGGRGGNVYPFDALAVNQSFHVAATETKPNPAKSLASTISSANKRFKKAGKDNCFRVAAVDATDPRGAGARVWRIA